MRPTARKSHFSLFHFTFTAFFKSRYLSALFFLAQLNSTSLLVLYGWDIMWVLMEWNGMGRTPPASDGWMDPNLTVLALSFFVAVCMT